TASSSTIKMVALMDETPGSRRAMSQAIRGGSAKCMPERKPREAAGKITFQRSRCPEFETHKNSLYDFWDSETARRCRKNADTPRIPASGRSAFAKHALLFERASTPCDGRPTPDLTGACLTGAWILLCFIQAAIAAIGASSEEDYLSIRRRSWRVSLRRNFCAAIGFLACSWCCRW